MDGTILNGSGETYTKTVDFLKDYPIPLTMVSARALMEMQFAIDELGLTGP
ncbi:MAG: HAD family phosphatase, partial [Lactobacillus paragasseri]|nr:HAD family phosphatase [Lactobacillus paragasseri]